MPPAARPAATSPPDPASRTWRAIGTTVSVLTTEPGEIELAALLLRTEVETLDWACSRFRADSELEQAHRAGGAAVVVSPLLADLLGAAFDVAESTGGLVDPTVGRAVRHLGYDRDFESMAMVGPDLADDPRPVPGWTEVEFDRARRTLRIPAGVCLDLGSTAKALTADKSAERIASTTGSGVLVNLGGDIAVSGQPPDDGWRVGIDLDSATPPGQALHNVSIRGGGLASSGTCVRSWRRGQRRLHHIVDPRTGDAAATDWRLVSVAAESCLRANAAATAAVILGQDAPAWLRAMGLPARLVAAAGLPDVFVAGWPQDVTTTFAA
ncbi:MAG TPA: FAD:protein FMN transferase [Acidimicrobiales bacterium]|jgi:thiamine biosynthesis lipoprotein|nr:FAD:protein FMN transferase [Acidimicrobiales bacterium]